MIKGYCRWLEMSLLPAIINKYSHYFLTNLAHILQLPPWKSLQNASHFTYRQCFTLYSEIKSSTLASTLAFYANFKLVQFNPSILGLGVNWYISKIL